jgi:hypothetical protein
MRTDVDTPFQVAVDREHLKWLKARTALAGLLGFGAWVSGGALTTGAFNLLPFAAICGGAGLAIYGMVCVLHTLLGGPARPPDGFAADGRWALALVVCGATVGLAAPLYVA